MRHGLFDVAAALIVAAVPFFPCDASADEEQTDTRPAEIQKAYENACFVCSWYFAEHFTHVDCGSTFRVHELMKCADICIEAGWKSTTLLLGKQLKDCALAENDFAASSAPAAPLAGASSGD